MGGRRLDGQVGRLVGHTRLVQVHILGELLLQHVLELLVHLPKVLVTWLHQVSQDTAQPAAVRVACCHRYICKGSG